MPLGLIAGQMLMNGANTAMQQGLNMYNYNVQRKDALSDYSRDVAYNDPSAQVGRLQKAGISPYASSGQSLLATSPNTRSATMGQGASNKAIEWQQAQMGMEQIKLLKLQQAKTEAETSSVQADVNNKTLDYKSNSNLYSGDNQSVLEKKRQYEIEKLLSDIGVNSERSRNISQNTSNQSAANSGIKANSALAEIEKLYRSQLLRGKSDLMQGQTRNILLKNYEQDVKNHFSRTNEGNKASLLQSEAALRRQEAELSNVLPASVRYFLEKMGGNSAIGGSMSKITSLMLRKLLMR
nr:MAG: DNA pilot protein [Microvirus sp.]